MDLGTLASRFSEVRWLNDEKFRSHCPCPTHTDGDPDCSLLVRQSNGRIMVYCYGAAGDSQESILTALGLTPADLKVNSEVNTPALTTEMPGPAPGMPAAALSTNGTTHDAITSNGHVERPQTRDFGKWQLEVGYQFKLWFSRVSENERELLASHEEDTLVETLVTQAKDLIAAQKLPLFPLPELNESELDEELHRLAAKVVQAFRDDYLPAIQENRLPATVPARELVICENSEQAEVSNAEYLSRPAMVEGLDYARAISLGVGGKHEGKTTGVRTKGLAISAGLKLWGRATSQTHVIYAASSDEYATTRMELLRMGWRKRDLPLTLIRVGDEAAEPREILDGIAELAVKQGARYVVLDMLFDFLRVQDENKYAQTRAAAGLIQTLADNINGHVHATHHSPKWMPDAATAAKAALGSQGIAARFSPITLSKKWADDLYTIESTMTRDPRGSALKPSVIVRGEDGWAEMVGEFKPWMKWRMYAERIIGLFEGEEGRRMSVAQVMEALEISRVETQNALYQMSRSEEGPLDRERAGKSYQYFLKKIDLFSRRDQ